MKTDVVFKRAYNDALDLIGSCGVIIPAYNEEATLAAVVRAALDAELGLDGRRDIDLGDHAEALGLLEKAEKKEKELLF